MEQENILIFTDDNGEEARFEIIERTKLVGKEYLLVCPIDFIEDENEDDEYDTALILKEVMVDGSEEAVYEILEDENEMILIGNLFKELNDDIELY